MGGILDAIRGVTDRAGFEADRFMRANRVRSEISDLKKQVEAKYAEVGHLIVEMRRAGTSQIDLNEIERRSDEIGALERDLKLKEAEQLAVQNEKWEESADYLDQQQRKYEQQRQLPPHQAIPGQGYTLPPGGQTYQSPTYNQMPQSHYSGPHIEPGEAFPVSSVQTVPPHPQPQSQPPPQPQQAQPPPMPQPAPQQPRPQTAPFPTPMPMSQPQPTQAQPQPEPMVEPPTQKMDAVYCQVCGSALRVGARFCQSCGTVVKGA